MSNNKVKDWAELLKLNELPSLADLVFVGSIIIPVMFIAPSGNPLEEHNPDTFRDDAMRKLPKIKKLDGRDQVQSFFYCRNTFRSRHRRRRNLAKNLTDYKINYKKNVLHTHISFICRRSRGGDGGRYTS